MAEFVTSAKYLTVAGESLRNPDLCTNVNLFKSRFPGSPYAEVFIVCVCNFREHTQVALDGNGFDLNDPKDEAEARYEADAEAIEKAGTIAESHAAKCRFFRPS